MTIAIQVSVDDRTVLFREYQSTEVVPIPEVGEFVVHPETDGLIVKVKTRLFDYREGRIIVTLDC